MLCAAMTLVIGLTGGIGSGKSTVGAHLAELGATLIDADAIVHELQAAGTPLLAAIVEEFGLEILNPDRSLNREALGAIVFRDETARAKLGTLVHAPVIGEMMRRAAEAVASKEPAAILDIPLLFEGRRSGRGSGALMTFDATILVWVPRDVQITRTQERDQCERAEAERRVAAQLPIDEKREMADHVIDNSGTPAETRAQVEALYAELLASSSAPR